MGMIMRGPILLDTPLPVRVPKDGYGEGRSICNGGNFVGAHEQTNTPHSSPTRRQAVKDA